MSATRMGVAIPMRLAERRPSMSRSWSLRTWLMLLVFAAITPLVIWGVFQAVNDYLVQRRALVGATTNVAAAVGRSAEQELDRQLLALEALATMPALQQGDFAGFTAQALTYLTSIAAGGHLFVFDVTGTPVFAAGIEVSRPPRQRRDPSVSARIFATGNPEISGVTRGIFSGDPVVQVDVPVRRNGVVVYDLALGLPLARMQLSLEEAKLEDGWFVVLLDAAGGIVARRPSPEGGSWKQTDAGINALLRSEDPTGAAGLLLPNGSPVLAVYARAPHLGWSAVVGIPFAAIFAPLRIALARILIVGVGTLALSVGLALLVARRLARPVASLANVTGALESGERLPLPEPGLREVDAVARALEDAVRRRRSAEEAAEEAEQRASRMIEAMSCGVVLFSTDGKCSFVNRAACELLGRSVEDLATLSVPSPEIDVRDPEGNPIPPEERASARALRGESVRDLEVSMLRGDGKRIALLLTSAALRDRTGRVTGALTAMVDVTERRAAQERVARLLQTLEARVREEVAAREAAQIAAAQAQKMQALGQLAGGVAHDFNNVLQAVSGAVSLIETRADNPSEVLRFARTAAAAAERGSAVAGRLLSFARRGGLRPAPVYAAELLRDVREILAHTLGTQITVRLAVSGRAGSLLADKAQLETALLNLAANARDAMPEGGMLTLRAEPDTVMETLRHPAGLRSGAYVRLDVVDTGTGMDAATLARATEPFFTTKPIDKGTGLGLAMARGVAEELGGGLAIRSAPARGTTVSLWLPVADAAPGEAEFATPAPSRIDAGLRVLLVDDEPIIRDLLAEQLGERGMLVEQASGAQAAVELLRETRFDVLVTDQSMPGESGLTLIGLARRLRPRLPAILLTGLSAELSGTLGSDPETAEFTELAGKPVRAAELAASITRLAAAARNFA